MLFSNKVTCSVRSWLHYKKELSCWWVSFRERNICGKMYPLGNRSGERGWVIMVGLGWITSSVQSTLSVHFMCSCSAFVDDKIEKHKSCRSAEKLFTRWRKPFHGCSARPGCSSQKHTSLLLGFMFSLHFATSQFEKHPPSLPLAHKHIKVSVTIDTTSRNPNHVSASLKHL